MSRAIAPRELGLDTADLRARRRAFARPCPDLTELRPHLAGALGDGIAQQMLDLDWMARRSRSRGLRIIEEGQRQLRDELGANLAIGV